MFPKLPRDARAGASSLAVAFFRLLSVTQSLMSSKVKIALALGRLQGTRETLRLITTGADARKAGVKAHLLAFVLGCSPCKTQKELAAKLGRSPARCCQMLATFKQAWRNSP